MNSLISIIVPIYNVQDYLERCVDSILNQTYRNLEIILVDDGSPDECGSICDYYSKIDKRIVVIHKENGGLSDARNAGLDIAKGKYITFIDSDDYISEDYVEYLYNLLLDNDADISVCNFEEVFINNINKSGKDINLDSKVKSYGTEQAIETMLYQEDFDHSAWGKLYKFNLFNKIRFPKGRIFEDLAINYIVFSEAKKIVYGSEKKYFYYIRKNSITNTEFDLKKMDLIYFSKDMVNFVRNKYPNLYEGALRRDIICNFQILRQILNNNKYKDYRKQIIKNIKLNSKVIFLNNKLKKKDRISIIAIFIGERVYGTVWRLYEKIKNKV